MNQKTFYTCMLFIYQMEPKSPGSRLLFQKKFLAQLRTTLTEGVRFLTMYCSRVQGSSTFCRIRWRGRRAVFRHGVIVYSAKTVLRNLQGGGPQDDVTGRCQFSFFLCILWKSWTNLFYTVKVEWNKIIIQRHCSLVFN